MAADAAAWNVEMACLDSTNDGGFLCAASDVAEGELREILADGPQGPSSFILTRRQGRVHGWYNVCPHAGRALNWAPDRFLTDGDDRLVCAAHGAVFRLPDGGCVEGPCRGAALTAIDIKEHDGGLYRRDR